MRDHTHFLQLFIVSLTFLMGMTGYATQKAIPPTYVNVSYGPHENNVLDFWKADAIQSSPVLVYIHGGGFNEGDKNGFARRDMEGINHALSMGVSVASINYRFITAAPLKDILRDAARAIQFIRFSANDWNIDKKRIAAFGVSAGAGTSLWLAFHDDLTDPENPDPVLRESTRLIAVGGIEPQASYDFSKWPEILDIPEMAWPISSLYVCPVYYHTKPWRAYTKANRIMRTDLDIISHLDPEDPPVYLSANQQNAPLDTVILLQMLCRWAWPVLTGKKLKNAPSFNSDLLHHPAHAHALENKCRLMGVPCNAIYKDTPKEKRVSAIDFLLEKLVAPETLTE